MAMGSKTQTSKPHENSSNNTHLCMFSGRKTYKKIWTLHAEIIQIWFHILYHCVPLFIAILQRFDSTHLNRINETISMFRDQTFDSMLKWFTSFIQLIYSAARGRSSILFTFATFSCSAPSRGLLTLPCNQHGRNVTSSTRVASC